MMNVQERLRYGRVASAAMAEGFTEREAQRLAFLAWRLNRRVTDAHTRSRRFKPSGRDHPGDGPGLEVKGV